MAETANDKAIEDQWEDVLVDLPSYATTPVLLQNLSDDRLIFVVFGGASTPPDTKTGFVLKPLEGVSGTATKIWVKSSRTGAKLGITQADY